MSPRPHARTRPAGVVAGLALALLAPLLAATGAAAAPPSPARGTSGASVPRLVWTSCPTERVPDRQCATATVPLDHDRPRGATTTVALARVPAADPSRRIGSLFINPGGPGGSGVQLLDSFGPYLQERLQGRFDVVGFDPRGIGASDPIRCFDTQDEADAAFADEPYFPYRASQFARYYRASTDYAAQCLGRRQAITAHMSTADVARDLDLLRRAVGDDELSYLGFSYGSYLGTTYANLYPGKVRALVIDGVLDPRLWSGGQQIKADRTSFQKTWDEFLRLCDVAGTSCDFATTGQTSARRWEQLARSLERRPLTLPDGSEYTYDVLINDAAGVTYDPRAWATAATYIDEVADAVLASDRQALGRVSTSREAVLSQVGRAPSDEPYDNMLDAYYGNQCADTEHVRSLAAFVLGDQYARAGSRFGPLQWWFSTPCARWPVNADRYTGPWTARTSSPVLVVGNYFDPATDYAGAVSTAKLLPHSRLLSYAGWGHTAYTTSDCVGARVDDYLLSGVLPPKGTVCPANPNPFLAPQVRAFGTPAGPRPWVLPR